MTRWSRTFHDEERRQVQGRLIGPVEVLDHEHDGGGGREASEHAQEELEEPTLG